MAASRRIFHYVPCSSSVNPGFRSLLTQAFRFKTTSTSPSHRNNHRDQQEYSKPSKFLGSWSPVNDPKEAEAKLALLRRDYAKQVKELRKQYIYEMELQRQEKQQEDEAKREAMRLAKEERKTAKAAMAEARAAERKVLEDEFRETLLKERAEKLENWRLKEKQREDKKGEMKELLRRQSSIWIDEADLEKKILEVIVDITPL